MGIWTRPVGKQFLVWLAAPSGLSWLDVGCGTGAFTETILAEAAPRDIRGVDPAEAQIAYARSRTIANAATFEIGDAQALPFADDRFDVAATALVIAFIPDPAKAVAEMSRVVRPGGCVATYMWDVAAGGLPQEPFRAAAQALGFSSVTRLPGAMGTTEDDFRALWQSAGLEAVETRRIEVELTFRDFAEFWDSNTCFPNPAVRYVRELSLEDTERVKAWVRAHVGQDEKGRVKCRAVANAVKGRVPG